MEIWQIKRYIRFRYTREQRKAMAGKIPMTYDLFWGCMDICHCRLDRKTLRQLMNTYPQFMREQKERYEERLRTDKAFREEQEAESRRLKQLCLEEFGEEWVKENWSGD
jgi:hypothetical protein